MSNLSKHESHESSKSQQVRDAEQLDLALKNSLEVELFKTHLNKTNSLLSKKFPLFLKDRKYSKPVGLNEPTVIENALEPDNPKSVKMIYSAANIIDTRDDKTRTFFASANEDLIIETLLDMCSHGTALLQSNSNGTFDIIFRKHGLFTELKKKGKGRSLADINQYLNILSLAGLEAIIPLDNGDVFTVKGSILQNVRILESDDPKRDGCIIAQLHPLLANDIKKGQYRQIEKKFLSDGGIEAGLYDTFIHLMRHSYLHSNADTNKRTLPWHITAKELFYANGNIQSLALSTIRKRLNAVRLMLIENNVIASTKDMAWKANDAKDDYNISIVTTIEWGKSQKVSNAIRKDNLKLLTEAKKTRN